MQKCMVKGEEVVKEKKAQEAEDVSVVRPHGLTTVNGMLLRNA